jgi:uncharacterized protein (DUF1697 family)
MKTYIAILRGINVSGHKMMKMVDLTTMLNGLSFKNIKTYIQSGNVVFQSKETAPAQLQKKIEKKIAETFGFEVPVMVIPVNEIETILKNNPFLKKKTVDVTNLHVTFLNGTYDKKIPIQLAEQKYGNDEFVATTTAIYLYCPDGYGNTKLSNTFWENKLKVVATTRNWKTVNELLKMANKPFGVNP